MNVFSSRLENLTKRPLPNLMAGLVMSLVLIPEAIGFAGIAGVPPQIGLYGAIFLTIIIAITGSRVAMITSASGSTAVLMAGLVTLGNSMDPKTGISMLLAASLFAGIFQILLGLFKIARLMKYVPDPVISGFVNALALLILQAEFPQLGFFQLFGLERYHHESYLPQDSQIIGIWLLVIIGLAIIYIAPLITKRIPSQLVSIAFVTTIASLFNMSLPRVGDLGVLPNSLHMPQIPFFAGQNNPIAFSTDTLMIILPASMAIALVGLLETFLTEAYIDEITKESSDKNNEAIGQGLANIATSLLGGMAGCALVGESVMNTRNGANTRLSTLSTGLFILILLIFGRNILESIPLAAVVAVMISIALATADSDSLTKINKLPKFDTLLMVATFGVTMLTHPHNLAVGVAVGVITSETYGYLQRKRINAQK